MTEGDPPLEDAVPTDLPDYAEEDAVDEDDEDDAVDEQSRESFPASDAPASWSGGGRSGDERPPLTGAGPD